MATPLSLTTWTRLEPRCQTEDVNESLATCIMDPCWTLTRQWQMGEFIGDDVGSPVAARVDYISMPLTRYKPAVPEADIAAGAFDSMTMPLEVLVERERLGFSSGSADYHPEKMLQRVIETGQHLLRLLSLHNGTEQIRAALLTSAGYRLSLPEDTTGLDPKTIRFLRLATARVPDGLKLLTDITTALLTGTEGCRALLNGLGLLELTDALVELTTDVFLTWRTWANSTYSEPAAGETSAWKPSRMEYQLSVAAAVPPTLEEAVRQERALTSGPDEAMEIALAARKYPGGSLDWFHFDVSYKGELGASADGGSWASQRTLFPQPVSFRGMPSERWWEFEDSQLNFAQVTASPEDEASMLLNELVLSFGNDWSIIPLKLYVGTLNRITSLSVTDTFGIRQRIKPSEQALPPAMAAWWSLFQLSVEQPQLGQARHSPFLFLPPSLPVHPESSAIERVHFMRDEGANMGWAVEEWVQGPTGGTINRAEQWMRTRSAVASSPLEGADLRYSLATAVPDHWLPLLRRGLGESVKYVLGKMTSVNAEGQPALVTPQGRIVADLVYTEAGPESEYLHEEEVPSEGARVTRSFQYARWVDGTQHLWVGREKRTGNGEGASGLRFDLAKAGQ